MPRCRGYRPEDSPPGRQDAESHGDTCSNTNPQLNALLQGNQEPFLIQMVICSNSYWLKEPEKLPLYQIPSPISWLPALHKLTLETRCCRVSGWISEAATARFFFSFLINLLIYLLMAALGLCCCTRAFSSCGERGLLFVAVRELLVEVASLAAEHGLQSTRASVVVPLLFFLLTCPTWGCENLLGSSHHLTSNSPGCYPT